MFCIASAGAWKTFCLNVYDEYEDYCEEHGLDSVTECLLFAGPVVTANFSNPSI